MTLDEETEAILQDENATTTAVKSLINVDERKKGGISNVELKTDLTENEVKIHSVLAVLNDTIDNGETEFNKACILGTLIERKERKSLSKNRMSRTEIVTVAKQPDINGADINNIAQESMVKKLVTSRRNPQ